MSTPFSGCGIINPLVPILGESLGSRSSDGRSWSIFKPLIHLAVVRTLGSFAFSSRPVAQVTPEETSVCLSNSVPET